MRQIQNIKKCELLIYRWYKNPIYSSPHCPLSLGALVTQMGRERVDTRDFNPSSAGRLGDWSITDR